MNIKINDKLTAIRFFLLAIAAIGVIMLSDRLFLFSFAAWLMLIITDIFTK